MERIMVIAPEGMVCPKENRSGMIDGVTPVPVVPTRYYRRRLAEKSLLRYVAPAAKNTRAKSEGSKA